MNVQHDRWFLAWVSGNSCKSEIWGTESCSLGILLWLMLIAYFPWQSASPLHSKIIVCSMLYIHLSLCQRLPALHLSAKGEYVPLLPLQVSALGWAAEESKCTEDSVWRWLRGCSIMEGQAGSWYSAVPAWFARDICQCPQSFVIKVVIFCLPAVVNYSAQPLSVFLFGTISEVLASYYLIMARELWSKVG